MKAIALVAVVHFLIVAVTAAPVARYEDVLSRDVAINSADEPFLLARSTIQPGLDLRSYEPSEWAEHLIARASLDEILGPRSDGQVMTLGRRGKCLLFSCFGRKKNNQQSASSHSRPGSPASQEEGQAHPDPVRTDMRTGDDVSTLHLHRKPGHNRMSTIFETIATPSPHASPASHHSQSPASSQHQP